MRVGPARLESIFPYHAVRLKSLNGFGLISGQGVFDCTRLNKKRYLNRLKAVL